MNIKERWIVLNEANGDSKIILNTKTVFVTENNIYCETCYALNDIILFQISISKKPIK
jgi:hypothetical protein